MMSGLVEQTHRRRAIGRGAFGEGYPMRNLMALTVAALVASGLAAADTFHLTTGVQFDGLILKTENGVHTVKAGPRTILLREAEIAQIETNDRNGELNMDEVRAQVAAEVQQLDQETGLTAEQRLRVDELIVKMRSAESADRLNARDSLVAMQAEVDVMKYLEYILPSLGHVDSPLVIEAMFVIDALRAKPTIEAGTQHAFFEIRAMCIDLLGRMRDKASMGQIARGLVDAKMEVRLAAVYALANLGAKEATPAFVEQLAAPDQRVSGASRKALETLWQPEIASSPVPESVTDWKGFLSPYEAQIGEAIQLAALEPLILPEQEFQDE
ncbi:MAG: HEAT repeat domain-containing protein [Candidatus Hydrogenedentes bacterium]|nr:HEAT repeat domain-containing protein [Candidatus Hydrogenedentota bacterium]